MNCTECIASLHDYIGGQLDVTATRAVETHVAHCAACRSQLESLRTLLAQVAELSREIEPPRDLWRGIEAQLHAPGVPVEIQPLRSSSTIVRWFVPLAVAASIAVLLTVNERLNHGWSVSALAGMPRVDTTSFRGEARLRVGQWLETDAASRAKVAVGSIGEVTVDPNSRLRLVGMAATDHRLELARGTMSAHIWAPPRLFFVDTPSATAVDLGCAYTLTVADNGDGELKVTTGYVALEHDDRESIIPMGMMCLTHRGSGPGTPFAVDAPETLRAALARFDFGADSSTALPEVLAHIRPETEDRITLWHLLARTRGPQRADVFNRLAQLSPPPAGVTREGILAGDVAMRREWGTALGLAR